MRNILSLDGGGTRGIFSLQILARMEALLREKFGRPDLVLADYFHFIGGTSTGAIIAAALSWGVTVAQIEEFYLNQSRQVFSRKTWWNRIRSKYHAEELSRLLRDFFSVDGRPALLGTDRLRTLYLCVMRNATTGSPWIMTNNPRAKFNQPGVADNNFDIPLYQLIRASTAAPIFFRPQEISAGDNSWMFLDGAVTPYNNPAFIMYLIATLPCFNLNWAEGEDRMRHHLDRHGPDARALRQDACQRNQCPRPGGPCGQRVDRFQQPAPGPELPCDWPMPVRRAARQRNPHASSIPPTASTSRRCAIRRCGWMASGSIRHRRRRPTAPPRRGGSFTAATITTC